MNPEQIGDPVIIALTRIETKLDATVAGHTDHETRIRTLEQKSTVTVASLWGGIVAAITAAVGLVALYNALIV